MPVYFISVTMVSYIRLAASRKTARIYFFRHVYLIEVTIAPGFHLFPFRTEKLSPVTPMVLRNSGRVGSRRFFEESPCTCVVSRGFLFPYIPPQGNTEFHRVFFYSMMRTPRVTRVPQSFFLFDDETCMTTNCLPIIALRGTLCHPVVKYILLPDNSTLWNSVSLCGEICL